MQNKPLEDIRRSITTEEFYKLNDFFFFFFFFFFQIFFSGLILYIINKQTKLIISE